jgi:hypothetical protein
MAPREQVSYRRRTDRPGRHRRPRYRLDRSGLCLASEPSANQSFGPAWCSMWSFWFHLGDCVQQRMCGNLAGHQLSRQNRLFGIDYKYGQLVPWCSRSRCVCCLIGCVCCFRPAGQARSPTKTSASTRALSLRDDPPCISDRGTKELVIDKMSVRSAAAAGRLSSQKYSPPGEAGALASMAPPTPPAPPRSALPRWAAA